MSKKNPVGDNTIDYKNLFFTLPVPRFLLEKGSDGFVIREANQKAQDAFQKDIKELQGQKLSSFFEENAARFLEESITAAEEKKTPVKIRSLPGLLGTSGLGSFVINPVISEDETVTYLDIMAIPGAEDAVSLQRERDDAISLLTSVFDVSEVGIVVTDQNQRIIRVNDSFIRIYGWSREDLLGKDFIELITEDEREIAKRNHEEFLKSGIRSSGEMKLLRRDGNIANALFTTAALELSQGRRFQVTTIMDITLRKHMELTLRVAKEQADAANQAKSTFLANMSHELRTPLNAIIGFSEMMIKETFGPLGNDKYGEYLDDIHLSACHLLEIINEVLDMSKIEAGRVELDEEFFNIGQMIVAVTRMMASRAFSSGLTIEEKIQDELPALYADPRLVRQVLINLVGNAVKYSNNGAVINVEALVSAHGSLHIIVKDTGVGIPKDKIGEALEPFGQINQSPEAKGIQGTGLGLPLAKAMVELHGGHLSLESDVGKGTKVLVELPLERLHKNQSKEENHDKDLVGSGK